MVVDIVEKVPDTISNRFKHNKTFEMTFNPVRALLEYEGCWHFEHRCLSSSTLTLINHAKSSVFQDSSLVLVSEAVDGEVA